MDTPRRILVIRLSALGDCVHTLPLIDRLRDAFPEAHLGWAIGPGPAELLRGHPQVDAFHVLPRSKGIAGWAARRRWLRETVAFRRELRRTRWDVALDVHGLTKSGVVTMWSRAPRRIGFGGSESRELNPWFLRERALLPRPPWHVIERNLSVLAALEVEVPVHPGPGVLPDYAVERDVLAPWIAETTSDRPFAVLQPGTTWDTKIWPASSFAQLAREIPQRFDLDVVLLWGGSGEEGRSRAITGEASSERVHMAPATSLRELAALISFSSLAIGNDSGPLHLAAALRVPSVGIFGATDPVRNGPWGQRTVVCSEPLECRPCWKKSCLREDLACLTRLSPDAVLEAAAQVLEEGSLQGETADILHR